MIDAMRVETGLPSIGHRIEEINLSAAIRHMTNRGGAVLLNKMKLNMSNSTSVNRRGRRGYIKELINQIDKHGLESHCHYVRPPDTPPPWETHSVEVDFSTPKTAVISELRKAMEQKITEVWRESDAIIFCDGSVQENGRAGCGEER